MQVNNKLFFFFGVNNSGEVTGHILKIHNTDYERLWNTISKTDKKILITLAMQEKVSVIA
jgi:hypothetical protein